jgi:hypothetical protein
MAIRKGETMIQIGEADCDYLTDFGIQGCG